MECYMEKYSTNVIDIDLPVTVKKRLEEYKFGCIELKATLSEGRILPSSINVCSARKTEFYTTKSLSVSRASLLDCIRRRIVFTEYQKNSTLAMIHLIDKSINEILKHYELIYKDMPPIVSKGRLKLLEQMKKLDEDSTFIPPINAKFRLDLVQLNITSNVGSHPESRTLLKQINEEISKRKNTIPVTLDSNRYRELGKMKLESLDDFIQPSTELEDYIQLKQLIAKVNTTAASSVISLYRYMTEFLIDRKIPKTASVVEIFTEYTPLIFRDWLIKNHIETAYIKPSTTKRLIQCLNKIIDILKVLSPHNFEMIEFVPHMTSSKNSFIADKSEQYLPYTSTERKDLFEAINLELQWADKFQESYKPTTQQVPKSNVKGLEKARWLLDNEDLDKNEEVHFIPKCWRKDSGELRLKSTGRTWEALKFLRDDPKSHTFDSLNALYIKTYRNQNRLLLPYLLKIVKVTGLNTEAVSSLKIDSLESKDLISNQPVLRYFKARSTGDKVLHLPLFSSNLQHIDSSQYEKLKKCFDAVIEITRHCRHLAEKEDADTLFIFHKHGSSSQQIINFTQIRRHTALFTNELKKLSKKYNLKNEKTGEPLIIVTGRFRPTLVSELLKSGSDIRSISHILGHKSLKTTFSYLEAHDFSEIAKTKVHNTEQEVHKKALNTMKVKPCQTASNVGAPPVTPTGLCSCKDVMNPPKWIKDSDSYEKGQPCGQFNQCLSCENVLISTEHLPSLFVQKRSLLKLVQLDNISKTPYGKFVKSQLQVLESVLDPKQSEFTREEIELADKHSLFITTELNDPFGS